jgi:hypothetical protein
MTLAWIAAVRLIFARWDDTTIKTKAEEAGSFNQLVEEVMNEDPPV